MKKLDILKNKLNINSDDLIIYDNFFKLKTDNYTNLEKKSKLILCTSVNPTQFGEGKTTVSIGLVDALNKLDHNAVGALREPSIGPVFGSKGGATGGGKSSLENDEDINLHFTGDMYSIELANNYISSIIDNHIYWKSPLKINPDKVLWNRTSNLLERSLRSIKTIISKEASRGDSYAVTAACSVMRVLTISENKQDFINRIEEALIAYSIDEKEIRIKDLNITKDIIKILNKTFFPNIAFSKEGSPFFIHCGPFANISVGTNSVLSTKIANSLSDYVVTESGFGSDLGFEKYMNLINYYNNDLVPDCVVLVISLRSLISHNDIENNFKLLQSHINNIKLYNLNFIVAINSFQNDNAEDLNKVKSYLTQNQVEFSIASNFSDGSEGCLDLANKVISKSNNKFDFKKLVSIKDSITEKINIVANNIYDCYKVLINKEIRQEIKNLEKDSKRSSYPLCFVKSPNSLTGNDLDSIEIKKIEFDDSTKMILVHLNNVYLMPGLGKKNI